MTTAEFNRVMETTPAGLLLTGDELTEIALQGNPEELAGMLYAVQLEALFNWHQTPPEPK